MDDRIEILNRLSVWELSVYLDLGGELPRWFERRAARLAEVAQLRLRHQFAAMALAMIAAHARPRVYEPAAVPARHRYHRRFSLLVCHQRPDLRLTSREAAELAGVTWSTFRQAMPLGRQIGGMTFEWLDDVKERQGAA